MARSRSPSVAGAAIPTSTSDLPASCCASDTRPPLREVLEETGAADPDADYRRLADMEYRDDEMALFESVLARIVSDGSLGRFSRAHVKETDRVK